MSSEKKWRRPSKWASILGAILWWPIEQLRPLWSIDLYRWQTWLVRCLHAFFDFHRPAWETAFKAVNPPAKVKTAHLLNPLYYVIWAARFVWNWFISRPYESVGPAIPAVLLSALLGIMVFELRYRRQGEKLQSYQLLFDSSLKGKDFPTASVALATLIDLSPEDLSLRYQRALLESQQGHKEEAVAQMLRLAVGKKYGAAAVWLVTNQLDLKNMGEWTEEQHKKFRAWTEIALQDTSDKRRLPAKTLMATYLYGIGAYAESIPYFEEIVPQSPEMAYAVATICRERGDERRTLAFANQSEAYFSKLLSSAPNNVDYRLGLAKALVLQNKEDRAVTILLDGYNLTKLEVFKTSAAECMVTHGERLGKSSNSPQTLLDRLKLCRQALELAPNSGFVMDCVVNLMFQIRNNENQEVMALRTALVQGLDEDSVHFIRGTVALLNSNFDEAKLHLEIASKKNPNLPGILNNLAVAMSESKTADFESALKLSNAALERMPAHPYLLETRGQILVKMERYAEAIPDLEAALKAPELALKVHEALAEAYEALGQKETAADHRLLATQATPASKLP